MAWKRSSVRLRYSPQKISLYGEIFQFYTKNNLHLCRICFSYHQPISKFNGRGHPPTGGLRYSPQKISLCGETFQFYTKNNLYLSSICFSYHQPISKFNGRGEILLYIGVANQQLIEYASYQQTP